MQNGTQEKEWITRGNGLSEMYRQGIVFDFNCSLFLIMKKNLFKW